MPFINFITLIVTLAGAINWGLVGFGEYDFIADLIGNGSVWARICYAFVGLCGVYSLRLLFIKNVYVKSKVHPKEQDEFFDAPADEEEHEE